jgi:hypothetical protein
MRHYYKLLGWILSKHLAEPIYHGHRVFLVLVIPGKWVHSIYANDHYLIAEVCRIITALHPAFIDSRVGGKCLISRHSFEKDIKHFVIDCRLLIQSGHLIMHSHVIVAYGRVDRHTWKCFCNH